MAPKVCVPADFGRHHIGAPSHGNLTFNLGEGVKIRANSIILSLNSPVIDELTTNLHQTSLEADDFSREAVDCFVECTYTGEIEAVNLGNFRDVNKMSRVFQVSWLVAKCEKYFVSCLDRLDSESSYSDMLFVVEEAVYLMSAIKSRDFLDLVVTQMNKISAACRKIASISVTKRDYFIKEYLADLSQASLHKIDACIAIVQSDHHVLVELLILHLKQVENKSLDSKSRYLLNNLDIAMCFEKKPEVHAELFSALEKLTEVTNEDLQVFVSIYKQMSSKATTSQQQVISSPSANSLYPNQIDFMMPAFDKLRSFKRYIEMPIGLVCDELIATENLSDLYLLIDALWLRVCISRGPPYPDFIQKTVDFAKQHCWSPICKEYAMALISDMYTKHFVRKLRSCHELVHDSYDKDTHVTVFQYSRPEFISEIFCKDNIFEFQIPGDRYTDQNFALSTTAVKDGNPDTFDLRWGMLNTLEGCTSTSLDLPKLHFALVASKNGDKWDFVLPISWCGKPTCDKSGTYWNWGYIKFHCECADSMHLLVGHHECFMNWPTYETIELNYVIAMIAFIIN